MPPGVKRRGAATATALARLLPAVIVALAGLLLLWSCLLPLTHGLWNDEAYSALEYIRPGPSGIFGHYIPNDQILFELLAWATTNLLGDFSEPAIRLWSVGPAIGAGMVTTWWLWRRLDAWVAAIFAVLAAAAPLYLDLSIQARGYGLGFLAAALMLIATDLLIWRRRRRDLLLFTGSAIVGIWTLPVFVLAFLPLAGLLMTRQPLRRTALLAVLGVGTASLLFYLPVIGDVVKSSGQHFGTQLPWYGFVSGPLKDLIAPSVAFLLPGASLAASEVIGGCLIIAGFVVLWRRPERFLALGLVAPTLFSYLFLDVARLYEASRYVSFLELPLLVLCAAAVVEVGRVLAKVRIGRPLAIAGAVAFSLLALGRAEISSSVSAQIPLENFKEAAQLVNASGISNVVSNSTKRVGFDYYFGTGRVHFQTPAELQSLFCSNAAPFVYLEHGLSPLADTTCLRQRGAIPIRVPQQTRSYVAVWLVTTVKSGEHPAGAASSARRTCPTVVEALANGANTATKVPLARAFTVDLRRVTPAVNATVRVAVTGTRLVASVAGEFTARGTTFLAPGRFLVVRYRITNIGPATVEAEQMINARFDIDGGPGGAILATPIFDKSCALVASSYAVENNGLSSYTHVLRGQTIDTVAAYPLPASLSAPAVVEKKLTWTSAALGITAPLPKPAR